MNAEYQRANWNDTFINIAHTIAKRSHDSQTQCGAVIVGEDNRIRGLGYNGFPQGAPDSDLPNTRPEKYKWVVHAEVNAILNCEHRPEGCTIYLTGFPCLNCTITMINAGIKCIIYDTSQEISMIDEQMIYDVTYIASKCDIEIIKFEQGGCREIISSSSKSDFRKFLERASKRVSEWPEWQQNIGFDMESQVPGWDTK